MTDNKSGRDVGIYLTEKAHHFSMKGCKVSGAAQDGLFNAGAMHTRLENCEASDNGRHGINVPAGTHLTGVTANRNGADGIYVRVPTDLANAILKDVKAGASGHDLVKKFGDRLKGFGVGLSAFVDLAANSAALYAFAQSLQS